MTLWYTGLDVPSKHAYIFITRHLPPHGFFCWLLHTKLTIQETVYVHLCVFMCILKYINMQSLAFYEVITLQLLILYLYTCIFHHLQHAWKSFSASVYQHHIRLLWISPHSKILPRMLIISRTHVHLGAISREYCGWWPQHLHLLFWRKIHFLNMFAGTGKPCTHDALCLYPYPKVVSCWH